MSKKQVLTLSFLVAIPAVILLVMLVLNGMEHGGKMLSGLMVVVVAVTFLLALFGVSLSPFAIMAFYPAEGLASMAPPPTDSSAQRQASGVDDDEDDGAFAADEDDGFDDEFADGEELYDDGDEEFADDDEEVW